MPHSEGLGVGLPHVVWGSTRQPITIGLGGAWASALSQSPLETPVLLRLRVAVPHGSLPVSRNSCEEYSPWAVEFFYFVNVLGTGVEKAAVSRTM